MEERLKACYERLQLLNVPATLENLEILVQTLYDLREMYDAVVRAGEEDGTTDT